jgi:hypothetical protein
MTYNQNIPINQIVATKDYPDIANQGDQLGFAFYVALSENTGRFFHTYEDAYEALYPGNAVPPMQLVVPEPPIVYGPDEGKPPAGRSSAARVPYFGNRFIVQVYLRRLRDRFFSKSLHERLHPLI